MKNSNLNIFDYTNFRTFLLEYYEEQKKINKAFSYRYFAKKAGYNSSGLYRDVATGRTSIHRNLILKFSKGIGFNKKEEEFFEYLVYFNDTKNLEEKQEYFDRMMKFITPQSSTIDPSQYEYFSQWFYCVVREILEIKNYKNNYVAIAKSLLPRITKEQAKKAILVLLKYGFIKKNEKGYYKPTTPSITTGADIRSLAIAGFQKRMSIMGGEAITRFNSDERDISTVTMSIPFALLKDFKSEIRGLRKKLINMADNSKEIDSIYQVNIQLYPVAKIRKN